MMRRAVQLVTLYVSAITKTSILYFVVLLQESGQWRTSRFLFTTCFLLQEPPRRYDGRCAILLHLSFCPHISLTFLSFPFLSFLFFFSHLLILDFIFFFQIYFLSSYESEQKLIKSDIFR